MEQIINSKVCIKCKKDKSFSQFSKDKNGKLGLKSQCKTCVSERGKQKQPIVLTLEQQNVITKVCTGCNIEKNYDEFYKDKNGKFGLQSECKTCQSERQKQRMKQLQPIVLTLEEKNTITKVCTECNIEKSYYEFDKKKKGKFGIYSQCKVCVSEQNKQRKQKPEVKARRNERLRERLKTDPKFKLDQNMSNAIRQSLKSRGSSKGGSSWLDYVDYTLEQLAEHLEKQFDDKMTWENQGSYWDVDHIIAKATFNYSSPYDEEFKKCWALDNLQPLEKKDNMSKGKKSMEEWLSSKGTKDGTDC